MAFFLILVFVAVVVVLIRATDRTDSPASPRQVPAGQPASPSMTERAQADGPDRRYRLLRRDIDANVKWFLQQPQSPRVTKDGLLQTAGMIYSPGILAVVARKLNSRDRQERLYTEAAVLDDAQYVFLNAVHLPGDVMNPLASTTFEQELECDLLSEGPGTPGETACSVVDAYSMIVSRGDSHEENWEEAFIYVLRLRSRAYVTSGSAPMPLMVADDLIWLSAENEVGCLAAFALCIVWFESSPEQRAALLNRRTLEATSRAVHRTVWRKRKDAVVLRSEKALSDKATQKLTAALSEKMNARVAYALPHAYI